MRRTPISALLVLIPVLSMLAACGASGGDALATSDGKTTTTEADAPGDDGGGDATLAALAEILPTAEDIGPGYELSSEDLGDDPDESDDDEEADEPDPTEQAIIDACPGAEVLDEIDSGGANPDEVSREFTNESQGDTTVEVALDATPDAFTEETIDAVVDALSNCGTIETEDEDGGQIEIELSAEKSDEFGDFGLEISMSATFTLMGTEVPIEFRGLIFDVDGTTVSVVATSGLHDTTYEAIPGDYDLLPELATLMEERVGSL